MFQTLRLYPPKPHFLLRNVKNGRIVLTTFFNAWMGEGRAVLSTESSTIGLYPRESSLPSMIPLSQPTVKRVSVTGMTVTGTSLTVCSVTLRLSAARALYPSTVAAVSPSTVARVVYPGMYRGGIYTGGTYPAWYREDYTHQGASLA